MSESIRLTQFSPGAGCGCKIAPALLRQILDAGKLSTPDPRLLVGYDTADDAAVLDLGGGQALVATTDFFTPVVDDPFDFGRIAATNALSDVWAMGGRPILALALLGWPTDRLDACTAAAVLDGARAVCAQAGIALAGGHSIAISDPVFGLAVNGLVEVGRCKRNATARLGDRLYLTKPLGIGLLTTAIKRGLADAAAVAEGVRMMTTLNAAGARFAELDGVTALTDVTGFGLLGHLRELAAGSGLDAILWTERLALLPRTADWVEAGAVPGGTGRNWESYGTSVELGAELPAPAGSALAGGEWWRRVLADPQTSGGLLVAVRPEAEAAFRELAARLGPELVPALEPDGRLEPIGELKAGSGRIRAL
jgi:selenide,water dikinase